MRASAPSTRSLRCCGNERRSVFAGLNPAGVGHNEAGQPGKDSMPDSLTVAVPLALDRVAEYDAIAIGAGISGMYMLHRLRELGMNALAFETGSDVGGTWYWNRYPGARFDSESWTYGYSFSKELLQQWDWREHFSP